MTYFAHNQQQASPITVAPCPPEIAQAINDVMNAVERLAKDSKNDHGNYRYASIDAFYDAVRPCLAAAGLIIKPVKVGRAEVFERQTQKGVRRMLRFEFKYRFIHKSGAMWTDEEDIREVSVDDTGAQAFGSAESYALKGFMRSLLQIATGEGDADAQERIDNEVAKAKVKAEIAARETREEHIAFDIGKGMQPIPVSQISEGAVAHAKTITTVAAFDDWLKGNEHGRAALHATDKAMAISLRAKLNDIRKALAAKPPPAADDTFPGDLPLNGGGKH